LFFRQAAAAGVLAAAATIKTSEEFVMYYIAEKNPPYLWRKVRKLKDFKPKEGVEYAVARTQKDIESGQFIPTYVGVNGKLKKTDDFSMFF
tara:strand:+ start:139 stop:411 length:273 start_codon:yes stop_codon:yes gene_type:complete